METGTARYGPVRRVVWGPEANHLRLPDSPSVFHVAPVSRLSKRPAISESKVSLDLR